VLEFLLVNHPLDCPVCDRGGECPLQDQTLAFGPGESRFVEEKRHFEKPILIGPLTLLDRERCIQCARCVRFQSELVAEPVIGFYQRGRALEIVSFSDPGFDSVFSGNTTDICPVGALTTADFRFGARPWELKAAASICGQCPVGCNITFNTRREAKSGGRVVIKRVMPRQNEQVNEIWICDKGRFAYHYTESPERLSRPLVRRDGKLKPASWPAALKLAGEKLAAAGKDTLVLAGGRLSNEDLFNLKSLADGLGGRAVLYSDMGGGDLTALVGIGQGANLGDLGQGDAVLVVACDLQEEAPIWWLRVKQAADRGATLIVANPRQTKLDAHAAFVIRYANGDEVKTIQGLGKKGDKILQAFTDAKNAVILFGSEGLGLEGSTALAAACARLLVETGHIPAPAADGTSRPNNGLIGVWQRPNDQGAWELGFRPEPNLAAALKGKTVYIAAADPAGDDPALARALKGARAVIVQDLFQTATAGLAEVVLPAQAYTERGGTYTSGERRVQRFYPAVPPRGEGRPDFTITAQVGSRLGLDLEATGPSLVFDRMAASVPAFAGLSYHRLAEVSEQWPIVGRGDLYYGGSTYENTQGLGAQLVPAAQRGEAVVLPKVPAVSALRPQEDEWLAVPVTHLYDHGATVLPSTLLHERMGELTVTLHPAAAGRLGVGAGERLKVTLNGVTAEALVRLDDTISTGVVLVPRGMGLPAAAPAAVRVKAVKKAAAK
jgi:NADH-quinone oxidoreductase subunit G